MEEILRKYINWVSLNKAKNTVKVYVYHLQNLFKEISISKLNEDNIVEYLLKQKEQLAPSSINQIRSAIKSFLKFLKKDIDLPKQLKRIEKPVEFITEEYLKTEIIPTIEAISKTPLRDKTVIYFMFYTAMRISETCSLKRSDFNLIKKNVTFLNQKSSKEVRIPYTTFVRDLLKAYFSIEAEERGAFNYKTGTLRRKFHRWKSWFRDINFHPHLLRHSGATHMRKKGISIENLKEILGHKDIKTTMRYAHPDQESIEKDYHRKVG
jgi:integrase/recombinase XerD